MAGLTPTRPEITPTMPGLTPTRPESTPARSETGTELASAWSVCAPTGLPTKPAVRAHEPTVNGIEQSSVDGTNQSATQVAHDGSTVAEHSAGVIHGRGNSIGHHRAAILRNCGNKAGPIPPVARVIPPVARVVAPVARVVAPVARVVAVLVSHGLLQTADRVAWTKVQARHRAGHRGGELVRRHIDQAGIGHRLPGRRNESSGRVWIDKQIQDVLDQRVHDQFPSNSPKLFAGQTGVLIDTLWIPRLLRIGA